MQKFSQNRALRLNPSDYGKILSKSGSASQLREGVRRVRKTRGMEREREKESKREQVYIRGRLEI
jgi:predicted RNA-binding protein YlqC (UPF0109 family)